MEVRTVGYPNYASGYSETSTLFLRFTLLATHLCILFINTYVLVNPIFPQGTPFGQVFWENNIANCFTIKRVKHIHCIFPAF